MAMLSPVAGLRPWRAGRLRVAKVPEARDRDLFAARQSLGNGGEYRGDGAVGRGPGDGGPRGDAWTPARSCSWFLPSRRDRTPVPYAAADQVERAARVG